MNKKVKKKKFKLGAILLVILFVYLLFSFGFYLFNLPIRSINISNNNYLTEDYIISKLNLSNKKLFRISTTSMEKKLEGDDFINSAKISRDIFGSININIDEEKILFYNKSIDKISFKDKDIKSDILINPILINYVPDNVYNKFKEKIYNIDENIIRQISEIEYKPDILDDKIIDDSRFLLRMVDGVKVYINLYNFNKLNNYFDIYDAIDNKINDTSCLFLDTDGKNYVYSSCNKKVVQEDESEL